MKISHIFGIIISCILIIVGIAFPVPDKHIFTSSSSYVNGSDWGSEWGEEYVGGDAYNIQIEASLKAGWVSGVLALKSVGVASGIILLMLTLYAHSREKEIKRQTELKQLSIAKQDRIIALLEYQNQHIYTTNLSSNDYSKDEELPSL